jgi:hypothetical protein
MRSLTQTKKEYKSSHTTQLRLSSKSKLKMRERGVSNNLILLISSPTNVVKLWQLRQHLDRAQAQVIKTCRHMAYDAELEYKPSYQENKESLLEVLNKTNKEDHKHEKWIKLFESDKAQEINLCNCT